MEHIVNRPSVGLDLAQELVQAALTTARDADVLAAVAVVGAAGDLIAYARMDGAPPISESVARDKAYTAAATGGFPTDGLAAALDADPAMAHGLTNVDRIMIFGGGVPVVASGAVVGAVGVSGGSSAQDTAIARAAADHATALLAGDLR